MMSTPAFGTPSFHRHFTTSACALVLVVAMAGSARAGTTCVGDCDGNGTVSIGELIVAVNIALGSNPLSACRAADGDRNERVEVTDLIRAVNAALSSCPLEDPIDAALAKLADGDVVSAERGLTAVVQARPNDPRGNLFLALTRLLTSIAGDPTLIDLLGRARVRTTGGLEDMCAMHVAFPTAIPEGAPRSQEILDTVRAESVLPLQDALDRLAKIPANAVIPFDLNRLPACLRPSRPITVEIDRGDVLALRAALQAALGAAQLLTAYNLDVRLGDAAELSPRMVFEASPDLFTLRSADRLTAARSAARQSAEALADAIDTIQAETDDQSDDVLVILPEDSAEARRLQAGARLFDDAVTRAVTIPTDVGLPQPRQLDLSVLFDGRLHSLRQFVPPFDSAGNPDPGRLPDPTFGGILPDLTQADIDELVRGGRRCLPCASATDCVGLGLTPGLDCLECSDFCDPGQSPKRCAVPDGSTFCGNGFY